MKDMPPSKSFHLDLSNFESSAAANCQYVLTSPRSLKACKKAGIKPVELLHRSLSEIIEDLNLPLDVASNIYDQHERDRQAKIQICQNIRNRLINEEIKKSIVSKRTIESRKGSITSRKEQLDKENFLKASSTSPSFKGNVSVSSKDSDLLKKSNFSGILNNESSLSSSPVSLYSLKHNAAGPFTSKTLPYNFNTQKLLETSSISSSSFSPLSTPRQCSSTLPSKKYEVKNSKAQLFCKKKKIKKRPKISTKNILKEFDDDYIYKLFPKSLSKYHPQIANYFNGKFLNSKVSTSTDYLKDNIHGAKKCGGFNKIKQLTKNNSTTSKRKSCVSPMQFNEKPKNSVISKKHSFLIKNDVCQNEITDIAHTLEIHDKVFPKKNNAVKRGSLQNLSTSQLKRDRQFCSSTSSLGAVQPKRKEKTYSFLNVDKLKIPESDRRILETLALKKEQEKECEEFAHRAHLLWEADQQKRREIENQKKKKWQQLVEEKRRIENEENLMRLEEIKESLRQSQKFLEENLQRRHEQAEKLKKEAEERKILELLERKAIESKRRAIVDANLKQKEIETSLQQQRHRQELEERLERAEHSREKEKEITHRRIASANRVEELRHHENWCDVNAEKELILEQKRREIEEKEDRSKHHYFGYLKHREKHIQENRIDREMRLELAKEMQRELEKGLEAWQDQVLLLQCSALDRAGASASMNIENKRLQVECENTQRQLEHSNRLRRVKEIENMRKESMENIIRAKEEKIHHLQKQREKTLEEGRIQAHITADLREKLRCSLSPETFDRKVARAEIELKVGNRPLTASPTTMMESHIQLG